MSEHQMQSTDCVIGIDTSCYTTSVAVVNQLDEILHDGRQMLEVKLGELGLRQSDAFFKHVQNLPALLENVFAALHALPTKTVVKAVVVSSRPRHVEGSYMPVFTAGHSFARTLSAALNVPLIETDHQSGHIMAGCLGSKQLLDAQKPFVALHMSGGTTEILKCAYQGRHFSETLVGGTKDLSMGSLIDRLGVKCNLPFPSGRHMEQAVLSAIESGEVYEPLKFPINHKEGWFNLSGMEAYCLKYLGNVPHEHLFYSLFEACAHVLAKALIYTCKTECCDHVLVVGGVASNTFIRDLLQEALQQHDIQVHFSLTGLSTDNAVGVAALGCHSIHL